MSDAIFIEFSRVDMQYEKDFLKRLVGALLQDLKTLRIDHVEGAKSLDETVELLQKEGALEFLIGNPPYGLGLHVHRAEGGSVVSLSVDEYAVNSRNKYSERNIKDLIERCKRTYLCIRPSYGRGDLGLILERDGSEVNAPNLYRRKVFWLNFYGPEIVGQIGKDRLSSVPYGRVEDLADGGVMLVRGKTPNENHQYSEVIREHLFGKRGLLDRIRGR